MSPRPAPNTSTPAVLLGLVLALALGILGLTVGQGYRHLHGVILAQMENRDGEILHAVALSEQFGATNLAQRLRDPGEQLALTLKISQLQEGVLGVLLFDAHGGFITAFPPNVTTATLSGETVAKLRALQPVSHYRPDARLSDYFLINPAEAGNDTNGSPLLEVNIPIHAPGETQLLACAELLLDAHDFAAQSARIEQQLRLQAAGIFLLGGSLLAAALGWAYHRLRKADCVIQERTAGLVRANNELMLVAKTSALGAVTAHLIHGLSNPLADLQDFVTAHGGAENQAEGWNEALQATQRMRQLVQEVVRVLGEGNTTDAYEITLAELARVLSGRIQPAARELGVRCEVTRLAEGLIANHPANIILLILQNLIENALQVTPRGGTVRVSFAVVNSEIVCRVSDEGPGFPEPLLKNLFSPCRSTKGGAGLGLAISRQLAGHLGARLELRRSAASGSVIELILPDELFAHRGALAAAAI